jgi:fucose permease
MTRSLRTTQYLAFVGLGLAQNVIGALLPRIQAEVPMSDLRAGLFGSGQFIGVLVVGLVGGALADRFGKKAFVLTASVILVAGLLGYTVAGAFLPLLAAAILAGLGGGGYEVGVNALQADHAEAADSGHGMNLLHAFYGMGAVAGPVAASFALEQGLGWKPVLVLAAVPPAAVAVLLASQRVPRGRTAPAEERAADLYLRPALWICGLLLMLYVGVEMSMGVWISTFWARRAPESALPAPMMSAVYWVTLTAFRLVSGKVADRIGHHRFLILEAAAVVIIGGAWALWPGPAVTLAATIGLGAVFAGVYPTAMALATDTFPGHSGTVVGFLLVFVALGGLLVPSAVGRLSDAHGIGVLPLVELAGGAALLLVVLALRLPRRAAQGVTPGSR